jgi:methionine-rich copper-binding protein CopC
MWIQDGEDTTEIILGMGTNGTINGFLTNNFNRTGRVGNLIDIGKSKELGASRAINPNRNSNTGNHRGTFSSLTVSNQNNPRRKLHSLKVNNQGNPRGMFSSLTLSNQNNLRRKFSNLTVSNQNNPRRKFSNLMVSNQSNLKSGRERKNHKNSARKGAHRAPFFTVIVERQLSAARVF